jgi:hypothetical protein
MSKTLYSFFLFTHVHYVSPKLCIVQWEIQETFLTVTFPRRKSGIYCLSKVIVCPKIEYNTLHEKFYIYNILNCSIN